MTEQTKALTIRETLEEKKPDIRALLPAHVDCDRFIKSALLAVARNSDLQKCTPKSLFTAIVNAAELGLDFTPAKGHAYLVPFSNHGVLEVQFMPGFRGLIDLARRSGAVTKMEAHLVYENDIFEIHYGTESKLVHKPLFRGDRGSLIGGYAVAFFKDALPQFEFMTIEELEAIKARSKSKDKEGNFKGAWKTDEHEMHRKAPVRRLSKYIPISPDYQEKWAKAIEADNKAVGLIDVDIVDQPLEDGEKTEQLAGKLDQKIQEKEAKESPAESWITKLQETEKIVGKKKVLEVVNSFDNYSFPLTETQAEAVWRKLQASA